MDHQSRLTAWDVPPENVDRHPRAEGRDGNEAMGDRDLLYIPPPECPRVYLHPSQLAPHRAATALFLALAPRYAQRRLENQLCDASGRDQCVVTSSGRAALRLALQAVGAGAGRKVVISTFNCPAVVDAAISLGATPVLVDIDSVNGSAFTSVDLAACPVVLTNALGIDEWSRWGAAILEHGGLPVLDLAQAVPAPEVLQRYADASAPIVLSFGESKALGGIGGGAVLFPAGSHPRAVRSSGVQSHECGPRDLGRAAARHVLLRAPERARLRVARRERRNPAWSPTKASHLPEEATPVSAAPPDRWTLAVSLALLDEASPMRLASVETHERVTGALAAGLIATPVTGAVPDLSTGIDVVFPHPGDRFRFGRALGAQGVQTTWNYYPLHRMRPFQEFASAPMPAADELWRRVLTLPKQRQPRLTPKMLVDAVTAAQRAVQQMTC